MSTSKTAPPFSCNRKPEIDYPCLWLYKVIGKDPESIREAIISSCKEVPVIISPSHSSSHGSYWSFNAELMVANEKMRLSIYQSLTEHPDIKLVL
jgi:uncharacterized protein